MLLLCLRERHVVVVIWGLDDQFPNFVHAFGPHSTSKTSEAKRAGGPHAIIGVSHSKKKDNS